MTWQQWSRLSQWVWEFMRDAPFSPREETITESLLVEMAREELPGVVFAKSTTGDESKRGHDWAWAIETESGWINLLVQAKKLSKESPGRYEDLKSTKAHNQAKKLINAAESAGALPVYALYNGQASPYDEVHAPAEVLYGGCDRVLLRRAPYSGHPPWVTGASPQGVTLVHAEDVRDYFSGEGLPETAAEKVNQLAMPWECFFCPIHAGRQQWPTFFGFWPTQGGIARASELVQPPGDPEDERGRRGWFYNRERAPWISDHEPQWAVLLRELRPTGEGFEAVEDELWQRLNLPPNVTGAVVVPLPA